MASKHDGGWRTTRSEYLFESSWFSLRQDRVELPSGSEITYTLIDHPGFVVVVPLLDDGDVLLERNFRYTVQETLLQCPAGGLGGELPLEAARRELVEETGFGAGAMQSLGRFYSSPGISDAAFEVFLATELHDTGQAHREETEQIELVQILLVEAADLARAGSITCVTTSFAILLADAHVSSG